MAGYVDYKHLPSEVLVTKNVYCLIFSIIKVKIYHSLKFLDFCRFEV